MPAALPARLSAPLVLLALGADEVTDLVGTTDELEAEAAALSSAAAAAVVAVAAASAVEVAFGVMVA